MTVKEAYLILGLTEQAALGNVKRAYKDAAVAWHPDRFTPGTQLHYRAQEKLKCLNEARSVLVKYLSERSSSEFSEENHHRHSGDDDSGPHRWSGVTYLGQDPRLDDSVISVFNRRQVSVILTSKSILLALSENEGVEYRKFSLVDLNFIDGHWSTPSTPWETRDSWDSSDFRQQMGSCDVSFRAVDPEGILPLVTVHLRFSNEYRTKAFCKRVVELFFTRDVVSWVKRKRAEELEAKRREQELKQRLEQEQRKRREDDRRARKEKARKEKWQGKNLAVVGNVDPLEIFALGAITACAAFSIWSLAMHSHVSTKGPSSAGGPPEKANITPPDSRDSVAQKVPFTPPKISEYQIPLPNDSLSVGVERHRQGRYSEAVSALKMALSGDPSTALSAANNLAWILSTCPDDSVRDGHEAIKYARLIQSESNGQSLRWNFCGTIAAAYAEIGEFDLAISWQKKSINDAPATWKLAQKERLQVYERHQPFRETASQIVKHSN